MENKYRFNSVKEVLMVFDYWEDVRCAFENGDINPNILIELMSWYNVL